MPTFNIHAEKIHLARLINQAAAGEDLVSARNDGAMAPLIPFEVPRTPSSKRQLGILAGQFTVPDDFDAPLPEELLALFEGG